MSLPRWMEPLPTAEEMRATDAWAIEERKVPSLELMERAGKGLARVVARHAPGRPDRRRLRQGQQRRRRARGRADPAPGRAATSRCWPSGRPTRSQGDAAGDARAPARRRRRSRSRPAASSTRSGIVDALLGTGATGAPREPAAAVIEAINAAGARVIAADVPSGVDATTGEVEGAAVTGAGHRHVPPRQAGPLDPPRQGPRGRGRGDRHRHPAGRAGRARDRPDLGAACSPRCRAARRSRPSSAPATCS